VEEKRDYLAHCVAPFIMNDQDVETLMAAVRAARR
jgi:hypothetical protein